jgi:hypothetical protein
MVKIKSFLRSTLDWIMEAQRRRAAYETAKVLAGNKDFKGWTFHELYHAVLDEKNPVYINKTAVPK